MGFSLKKLVKHAVADVNPFDGPQPGSTAHPSGISAVVKNVGQAVNRDVIHPVTHNAITNGVGAVAKELPQATVKTFSPLARSAVGTAQGVSGLVDLATPGNGTSRVSKGLNWEAQQLDKSPQLSKVYYHGGQAVGDIGQFALGGGAVKAASEIPKIGKAAEVASIIPNAIERGAATVTKGLREGNIAQRAVGNMIKNVANPTYQAGNAAFTGLQAGKEASQGKKVTPASVTTNLVIGGVGFPAAGAVAHEAAAPVIKAGVNQLKKTNLIAPSRLNPDELAHLSTFAQQARSGAINEPSVYDNGVAAAKKAGIDYRDSTAVDNLLGAHRNYDTAVQQRKEVLQKVNTGVQQFAQDHPIGLTSGAVNDAGERLGLDGKPLKVQPKASKVATNSLTGKVKLQNLSSETQAQVSGEHIVRNTADLAQTAGKTVDELPTNTAIEQAHAHVTQPLGSVNDEQTAFIAKTIEKTDIEATKARNAGNTVEADRLTRESAALHDALSEHATARGQANQALTMLYNQSPQGMLYHSLRDLGRGGVKDTPELRGKLQPHTDAVKLAKGEEAATQKAFAAGKATHEEVMAAKQKTMDAIGKFHQAVSQEMPQHIGDKLIGVWKAGLLSGVKTQQGNFISNATFGGLKKISDVPATAADKAMSLVTGERTKTATGTGIGQGTAEGGKNAKYTLKSGIDRRGAGDKYEQHAEINFKHPILNKTVGKFTRGVFRGMNAADQPFWYAGFKNSMYDQAKADGINRGLSGKALKEHMDNLVANPTEKMANTALSEANKSTLNYDTMASKAIQAVHTGIDKVQSLNGRPVPQQARTIAHNVIHVLAPFVRVPTAFLSRTVDFTPLGFGKELIHQVWNKQFDQRALSQAIGEGMTGTGAIALGIALTHNNLLSGDYPKNDQKEQQRWKTNQIQPNSVNLGGHWISLNYMGPLGLLFNAGHKLATSTSESDLTKVGVAIGGLGQGLMGQSFLQGFSGFSDAINDPARNAKSFINSQTASIVPAISNDVANLTDKWQRQADTVGQSVTNKIPWLRENNAKKQDVYGNDLKQAGGQLGTISGVKPSTDISNKTPATGEANRLHLVDPQNKDLQVTPTPVDKKITIPAATKGGKSTNISLNDKQRYDLQKAVGQATQTNWNNLIKTPEYQNMDDTTKAKKLNALRQDATELATRQFVVDNKLGEYGKPASRAASALASGDLSKYTSASDGTATASKALYTSPDAEYKALQTSYNTKAKAGWNSPADKIKADEALNKAKVGSTFDKKIRDAYNLSNADLYSYVSTDPDGKAIVEKVLAYSQALKDAGITSTAKFKTKYGVVTLGKSSGKSGSKSGRKSRGASNTKFASALKASNTANSSLDKALQNLVKNAKVTDRTGRSSKTLKVAKANLKKQSVKKQRAKAIA